MSLRASFLLLPFAACMNLGSLSTARASDFGLPGYNSLTVGKIFHRNANGTIYFVYNGDPREAYYVSPHEWAKIGVKSTLYAGTGAFSSCTLPGNTCGDVAPAAPHFREHYAHAARLLPGSADRRSIVVGRTRSAGKARCGTQSTMAPKPKRIAIR